MLKIPLSQTSLMGQAIAVASLGRRECQVQTELDLRDWPSWGAPGKALTETERRCEKQKTGRRWQFAYLAYLMFWEDIEQSPSEILEFWTSLQKHSRIIWLRCMLNASCPLLASGILVLGSLGRSLVLGVPLGPRVGADKESAPTCMHLAWAYLPRWYHGRFEYWVAANGACTNGCLSASEVVWVKRSLFLCCPAFPVAVQTLSKRAKTGHFRVTVCGVTVCPVSRHQADHSPRCL